MTMGCAGSVPLDTRLRGYDEMLVMAAKAGIQRPDA
jgi:hypothetical protein